jgi:hypothetical protein
VDVTGTITTAGGRLAAPNGITLTVPSGSLTQDSSASITGSATSGYDVSLDGPWQGNVAVTMPLAGPNDYVLHQRDGVWVPEAEPGQATVWVNHLSPFSTAANFLASKASKIAQNLCLTFTFSALIKCLALHGVKYVDKKTALWIASKFDNSCFTTLLVNGVYGPGDVLLSIFSGGCVAHAGEGNYTYTPTSAPPSIPVTTGGGVDQGNPVQIQGPTSPPQPPQAPATGPVFTVMNTSETPPDGVWFRNSPQTADTSRTTGLGIYAGEQVQLVCYATGDVVGPYNDSLWYKVANVTRPSNNGAPNTGFLNAHYIDDGQVANVVDAGVAAC